MKCIILCAGYATRLYPITENYPKALLKVGDKEILTYLIEEVNKIPSIDEIIIVSNNKFYDIFIEYISKVSTNKKLTVKNEGTNRVEDSLGIIASLKIGLSDINEEILVLAGDNLFDFDLLAVYNEYKKNNLSLVVCKKIDDYEELKRFGLVEIKDNLVTSFVEKPSEPKSNIVTFATYFFTQEVVAFVKENNFFAKDKPLIEYIYKPFGLIPYITNNNCYDIGTHESLEIVRNIYKAN